MRKTSPLAGYLTLAAATLLVGGCGKSDARRAVSGEITLQGRPLDAGAIEFEPLDDAVGTKSGAPIQDGRYQVPTQHGLSPGKYLVRITAGDPNVMEPTEDEIGAPSDKNRLSRERVPPEYNVASKQIVEVTAEGPNKFDFAIP